MADLPTGPLSRTFRLGVLALSVYAGSILVFGAVTMTAILRAGGVVPEGTMDAWGKALLGLAFLGACVAGAQGLRHVAEGGGFKGMLNGFLGKTTETTKTSETETTKTTTPPAADPAAGGA